MGGSRQRKLLSSTTVCEGHVPEGGSAADEEREDRAHPSKQHIKGGATVCTSEHGGHASRSSKLVTAMLDGRKVGAFGGE